MIYIENKTKETIISSKDKALKALKNTCRPLQYATEELKNNKELVLLSVAQYEGALKDASRELKMTWCSCFRLYVSIVGQWDLYRMS